MCIFFFFFSFPKGSFTEGEPRKIHWKDAIQNLENAEQKIANDLEFLKNVKLKNVNGGYDLENPD